MADVTKVQPSASLKLTRNGITLYNHRYTPEELDFVNSAADKLTLGANMGAPEAFNMGSVTTGTYLFIKTDRPILVSLNNNTDLWQLGVDDNAVEGGLLLVGEFTAVYLQNTHPTYDATVNIVVVGL